MKYKKIMLILITAIFLVSIASASASDANDTLVANEDTNQIEISDSDKTIEDNLQTSEENPTLAVDENDETLSYEIDSEILTADQFTYSDLKGQIGSGGNINLTKGTYTYNDSDGDTIEITTSGVINGNGAVIDMAQSGHRAFYVTAFGVTIKNLTIKNANYNGNGGAIYFSTSGTVTNCNFTNNQATGTNSLGGGAVFFEDNGDVINCNFTNNTATWNGGAINFQSTGNVTNCNFTNNQANYTGGAVYFSSNGEMTNCNFTDNKGTYGGAIRSKGKFTVINCNFTNNQANDGGAVDLSTGNVTNCNFIDNQATGTDSFGGAIFFTDTGTVTNCNFANNRANNGGAIINLGEHTSADTCIFKTESDTIDIQVIIVSPKLNVDNFTTFYGSGEKLTFDLRTNSGIPVTNGNISISIYYKNNDNWLANFSCLSGEGWTVDLPVGSYYANFTTEYAGFQAITRTITINKVKTELTAKTVTAAYNSNKKLIISLKDVNGKPLSGVKVTVKIKSDKTYTTDANGQVKISVGKLTPKTYNVKITFKENADFKASQTTVKVTVKKAKSKITAKKKTVKKAKYVVTLKSGKKPIQKAKILLKIKKKTFKAKTNKKGKATFKIKKLKKGKYTAKITFKGNKYYKKASQKVKITIK